MLALFSAARICPIAICACGLFLRPSQIAAACRYIAF